MSIIKPSPLSDVLDGKTTPKKKLSTPKTPATPKKPSQQKVSRNLFGVAKKKTSKKSRTAKLPKVVYIVCNESSRQPVSVHLTKHGADVFYWKKVSESDQKFMIVECDSGKD